MGDIPSPVSRFQPSKVIISEIGKVFFPNQYRLYDQAVNLTKASTVYHTLSKSILNFLPSNEHICA